MQGTIDSFKSEDPAVSSIVVADTKAREEISVLQAKLDKYEQIFGPASNLSSDAQTLRIRLEDAHAKIESLELQRRQEASVSDLLTVFKCSISVCHFSRPTTFTMNSRECPPPGRSLMDKTRRKWRLRHLCNPNSKGYLRRWALLSKPFGIR